MEDLRDRIKPLRRCRGVVGGCDQAMSEQLSTQQEADG